MRLHVVQTADSSDVGAPRDPARDGRAAAMSRRRALTAGRSALAPAPGRAGTGSRAAPDPQGPSQGTVVATDAVAAGRLGRALSMQRRRQLSKGKLALKGGGQPPETASGAGAPAFIVHDGGGG